MFNHVFVTVGTTSFEKLITLMLSKDALKLFKQWDVKHVRIQGGKYDPKKKTNDWNDDGVQFEMYDYKESLEEDMEWADLIISHAGAGTTIEALDRKKTLLVVPNETLMDNHQLELAKKLAKENYAFMASVDTFFEQALDVDPARVVPFPPAKTDALFEYIVKNIF